MTKETFIKDTLEVGQELFNEHDHKLRKQGISRIYRLGRAKSYYEGFVACMNLWFSVQFPQPEVESQPEQQAGQTEPDPKT